MSKKRLKAIYFDVDDTVYSITEFAYTARRNAIKAMIDAGLKIDEEEAFLELMQVIKEFGSNHSQHYDKLLKRFPPEILEGLNPLIIKTAGIVGYHQTKAREFAPYGDAIEVLKILKHRGLRLGIITAGMEIKQAEKIYRLGLHEIVAHDFMFITDHIGIAKTNPKLYMRACRKAGASPEEVMYIGDNPPVDIDVPAKLGMQTILSRRGGKYISTQGEMTPTYTVDNFYDVLDIIESDYEIIPV